MTDSQRYLQFFVNASIVVFVLYLVAMFILTVRRDVQDRMSEASIGECAYPSRRSKLIGRIDAGNLRVHSAVFGEQMRSCRSRARYVS